ncbi:hypothetical protein NL676_017785 [Syzygium grande]|nr:hypothetical protein NL676_017785 [Syzygium grande]
MGREARTAGAVSAADKMARAPQVPASRGTSRTRRLTPPMTSAKPRFFLLWGGGPGGAWCGTGVRASPPFSFSSGSSRCPSGAWGGGGECDTSWPTGARATRPHARHVTPVPPTHRSTYCAYRDTPGVPPKGTGCRP